jgi:hypothetical protein
MLFHPVYFYTALRAVRHCIRIFFDYFTTAAEVTPPEYPLVLNIIGDCLSEEEKKTIEAVIRDDFAYDLGMVEKEEKRHKQVFCFMAVELILLGLLLWFTKSLADEPRELLFIPFLPTGKNNRIDI